MPFTDWPERVRFGLPILGLGAITVVVAVRLVILHSNLSSREIDRPDYEFTRNTVGLRGTIYSADGRVLAKTTTTWEYHLDPQSALMDPLVTTKPMAPEKLEQHMRLVSDCLKLPYEKVRSAYANMKNRYQLLAVNDEQEVHDTLLARTNHIREVTATECQRRIYPNGSHLCHVLGFVTKDPTNSVGGAGIELKYERYLKGSLGEIHGTRDAKGQEDRSRRGLDIAAHPGCDIHLTVDQHIQNETERILREGMAEHRAEGAWAIVMRVKTGAILALASLPDYEPMNFNKYKNVCFINRPICESYEPGSVMKTITACAVINERRVGPNTMINTAKNDPNYYRLPGDAGHVWDPYMSVRDALVHSSNIVFGKLGVDLGPERLHGYMSRFGLGLRTGIELPGEEGGIVPDWRKWDKVKWSRAPIGQGVSVTAIQLAAAYACIGNDGEWVRPYIVEKVVQWNGDIVHSHARESLGQIITPQTARTVRGMMVGVAKKGGTAKRAAVVGYTVAGKTGTAQMKEGRGYSSTNYNASFVGIVPATKPEVVILVTFQKPFYCRSRDTSEREHVPVFNHQGGLCAAPVFSKIATSVMRLLEVEPDVPEEMPEDDELVGAF